MERKTTRTLALVVLFVIAMAYLEAAVVVYLRRLYSIGTEFLALPAFDPAIYRIELGREGATLLMLLAVSALAAETLQSRLGFFLFAFGLWDLGYYLGLRLLIGWPRSLLDVDLLFLLPLPWWGPILAPLLIAILMILTGLALILAEARGLAPVLRPLPLILLSLGLLLLLYTFMANALQAVLRRLPIPTAPPAAFPWSLFLAGVTLTVTALATLARSPRKF